MCESPISFIESPDSNLSDDPKMVDVSRTRFRQQDIQEILINGALNRLDEMEDGFYCPDMCIYSPAHTPYPSYSIREKIGTINKFTVRIHNAESGMPDSFHTVHDYLSNVSEYQFDPDIRRADRLPHSTTFKMISFRERQLSFLRSLLDDDDRRTPDYIKRRGTSTIVMEYATYAHNVKSAVSVYDDKLQKYAQAVCRRCSGVSAYYVIVVTPTCVITNHPLMTDSIASVLITLYQFSRAVVRDMHRLKRVEQPDERLAQALEAWDTHFGHITPLFDGKETIMTRSFYNLCRQVSQGQNICDQVVASAATQSSWNRAKASIKNMGNDFASFARRKSEAESQVRIALEKYFKDDPRGFELRSDPKTICQFPFLLMTPLAPDSPTSYALDHPKGLLSMPLGDLTGTAMSRLWSAVMTAVKAQKLSEVLDEEMLEDAFLDENKSREELVKLAEQKKLYRSKYHRVSPCLAPKDEVELAKAGLKAKRHKDDPSVQRAKLEGKRRFKVDTWVGDIDEFIRNASAYLTTGIAGSTENKSVTDLLHRSYMMHARGNQNLIDTSDALLDEYAEYHKTRLSHATKIIGEIAHEVAISMRQYCKPKDFIIKRLSRYPIWVLIAGHGVGLPVFYSIFFFDEDLIDEPLPSYFDTIFRKTHTNGVVRWTDFVSLVEPKLINPTKAHEQCMVYYRCFQSLADNSTCTPILSGVHGSHFALNVLLYFHNRQAPCDAATVVRYLFMESNVTFPRIPDPLKLLDKFSPNPHSRLEVYINTRIRLYMRHIMTHTIESTDTNEFHGFSSWLTLEPLDKARQCVNYCYQGYTANKQKHLEPQNLAKVCEAVTEKEIDFQRNLRLPDGLIGHGHGDKNPDQLKFSEFQRSFYMRAVNQMVKHHERVRGPRWRDELFTDYVESIMSTSVESMATLKATSMVNHGWRVVKDEVYKREKVLTEIYKLSRRVDSTEVATIAAESIKIMQEEKHMFICIFPKDQIAGVREIYVLRLESRMCQKMVERFSEHLCELMPNEIITHPENKFKVIHSHKEKTSRYQDKVTIGTSADKRKWNHGHTAAKFMLGLSRFIEPCMLDFFFATLQMWERRLIMPPQKLTNLLRRFENINTTSEPVQHLHRALVHNQNTELCDARSPMFKIQHGFMQGLLHFTSSAEHGRFLLQFTNFAKSVIITMKEKGYVWPKAKFFMDTMYSSDDSGLLMTLTDNGSVEMRNRHRVILSVIGEAMREQGALVGMYESPKSTFHTENRLEFNSRFMFGNSIEEPILRQVNSAVHVSNCESLVGQLEEANGILEGILENGGEFWLISHIQLAQAEFHYRLLGSEVNRYFNNHYRFLMDVPDPSLGFFPLDHPLCPSVLGMKYNYWVLSQESSLSSKYKFLLTSSRTGTKCKTMSLGLSSQSAIIGSTAVVFSNREKARKAFADSGLPLDWAETLEARPKEILINTRDPDIVYAKLAAKMHQRGVISKYGSSTSNELQPLRSAVYRIHRPCMSDHDYDLIEDDEEWAKHKTSMILEHRNYCRWEGNTIFARMTLFADKFLTEDERVVIFPSSKEYDRLRRTLDSFSHRQFATPLTRDDRKRSKLMVLEKSCEVAISLRTACEVTWGIKPPLDHMRSSIDSAFDYYCSRFPWLRNTLDETAMMCPFDSNRSLINYIMQYKHDSRLLHVSTPPISTSFGQSGLMEVVRVNYVQGKMLQLCSDSAREHIPGLPNMTQTQHELACILNSPFNSWFKTVTIHSMLQQVNDLPFEAVMRDSNPNKCAVMQDFSIIKAYENSSDWATIMQMEQRKNILCQRISLLRPAMMGVWVRRQRHVGREWLGKGTWAGRILNEQAQIDVDTVEGHTRLISVTVQSTSIIHEMLPVLRIWMKECQIDRPQGRPVYFGRKLITNSTHHDPEGSYLWKIEPDLDLGPLGSIQRMLNESFESFKLVAFKDRVKLLFDDSTVISYIPHSNDFDPNATQDRFNINIEGNEHSRKFMRYWITNRPIRIGDLAKIREFEADNITGRASSSKAFESWLDDGLQECVQHHGALPEREMPALNGILNTSIPILDPVYDDPGDDMFETYQLIPSLEVVEPEYDEDMFLVQCLTQQYADSFHRTISTKFHPMLDAHIACRRYWHDIALKRVYNRSSPEEVSLAKELARAYGFSGPTTWAIKVLERRVRLDISEPDAPTQAERPRGVQYVPERYDLDHD